MKLARSCALSLSNDPAYVLNFATQESSAEYPQGLFAASISGTNEIKIYSKDTFCSLASLVGHSERVTAIKFDLLNSDIIWSSSLDGTLRCWNIKEKTNHIFSKKDIGYTALDVNCDGTILAVGMESIDQDLIEEKEKKNSSVTVEFWDISEMNESKTPKYISKFESIHSDDVTHIVFHPENPKIVVTGSTDGLVAVLNVTTHEEETDLIHTLNTESSVSTIGYFGPSLEFVYVLTHIETFTIWKYMEGELLTDIIDLKKKTSEYNNINYVVDCLYHKASQRLFLVGGTHCGRMEILHFNLDVIEPYFTLSGGHSSIVRCIAFHGECLLTGGEDGMVCAWMAVQGTDADNKSLVNASKKAKRKQKRKEKKKPYKSVEETI